MTITINLTTPFEYNGSKIESLTFREATTGDLMAADAVTGDTSKQIAVLAGMAEQPLPAMRKISVRDLTRILGEVSSLLGESPSPDGPIVR